jgi:GT2 family glycosyltransferase
MEKNNLKILTVIVTYNGSKWIKKCIDSIQVSNIVTDIFVVDNASIDDSIFVLKSYSTIVLHESKYNLGFGQANNLGLKYALNNKYDYVFLLNQDTWIEKNTIEVLLTVAEKNKEYGIISPMHYFSDEKSLEYFFSTRISPFYCKNILSDFVVKGIEKMEDIYNLNFIQAAAWFLPIKTIESIGGFDPIFFHYGEDNNYCQRLNFHNIKIGVTPKTKIYHDCKTQEENQIILRNRKIDNLVLDYKVQFSNIKVKNITYLDLFKYVLKMLFKSLKRMMMFDFKEGSIFFVASLNCFLSINCIWKSRVVNLDLKSNYL